VRFVVIAACRKGKKKRPRDLPKAARRAGAGGKKEKSGCRNLLEKREGKEGGKKGAELFLPQT